jgi:hypothetical protein
VTPLVAAVKRPASKISAGPDGSKPISFPLLVQPVLDKHCVSCHGGRNPDGDIDLTGGRRRRRSRSEEDEDSRFTPAYRALAKHVKYSEWIVDHRDFRTANCEPITRPGFFGAVASPLTRLLETKHGDVELSEDEWDRLITWMDANALFYGTFDKEDQERQRRGERIAGPSHN